MPLDRRTFVAAGAALGAGPLAGGAPQTANSAPAKTTVLTQAEREAAYERIRRQLGMGHIGLGPNARPLPPRPHLAPQPGAALPIADELYGAQLFEYEIWARPALDLRTRSFITIAALSALRHADGLYRYINCALNIGITPNEVCECLLQAGVYGGLAAWEHASAIADEVFVARGVLPAGGGYHVKPKGPMTTDERNASMGRVLGALAIHKVGHGPDAPVLPTLPGGEEMRSSMLSSQLASDLGAIMGGYGYGEVWGREGLDLRIRSFITMAVLQIKVESHELHVHVNNALNLGISADDIYEGLAQAGVYGGGSGWHNATVVARFVFAHRESALSGR